MNTIWFFLDDEREPPTGSAHIDWVIFRTGEAMLALLGDHQTLPRGISFDHDLGSGCTGYDVVKTLLNRFLDGALDIPDDFMFKVHSQNPIGGRNITNTMNDIIRLSATQRAIGG